MVVADSVDARRAHRDLLTLAPRRPAYAMYKHVGRLRVHGYTETPTFTTLQVLDRCQRDMGLRGPVTEIGVHHGQLLIAMALLQRPGEGVVAVDLFDQQELNVDQSGKGDLAEFSRHIAHWLDSPVTVVQGDSTTLKPGVVPEMAGTRMFSVDGGHTSRIVESDMRLAARSLCDGGVVIADDVFNPQWPDVCVGTLKFMEDADLVPFGIGFNKALFTHTRYAEMYRQALRSRFDGYRFATLDKCFAGHDVVSLVKVPPRHMPRRSDALRRCYHAVLKRAARNGGRITRC
ncbi:class I SAM-dependent methyltransferase [Mycolicibacterium arenosum]|uniref:Class I SAM-dependent methyltransferase n=1 Tax=Mycolicibacterium arenosum TaxID=2952157 RepID=A0ABT1LWI6_9MYCO|nr:class I SAM-dependent methyltransferase [Mycolicibacterium sp. CAU 1645]MCP9270847.1 class I SAM-dependent methyltransferase [Mycolicibacterium sp. CAU 1645]